MSNWIHYLCYLRSWLALASFPYFLLHGVLHNVMIQYCPSATIIPPFWLHWSYSANYDLLIVLVSGCISMDAIHASKFNWSCTEIFSISIIAFYSEVRTEVLRHCAVLKASAINEPHYVQILAVEFQVLIRIVVHTWILKFQCIDFLLLHCFKCPTHFREHGCMSWLSW